MRVRALLWLTAIVSSVLGGVAVYLALSVPNDLAADAMLKTARQELSGGNTAAAREQLSRIVQQYPRTDAAAAATVALMRVADQDRARIEAEIARMRTEQEEQTRALANVNRTVTEVKNAPPKVVTVQAPAPKKTTPVKKTTPKKRTTTKKRRR